MSKSKGQNGKRAVSVYRTWDAYVDHVTTTPTPPHACGTSSTSDGYGEDWDLDLGWEGAVAMASTGWSEHHAKVESLTEHVESQVDTDLFQTSFESRYEVAGSEVDMGRFLAGEPECMIEATPIRISRHGRAVRLVVPISYSSGTDADQVLNRGAAVVALADLLARTQHPLEVWAVLCVDTTGQHCNGKADSWANGYQDLVKIQDANDPLDVDRLLFVLAHPGCFRRLGFRAMELTEDPEIASGLGYCYGYPNGIWTDDLPDQVENTIVLDHLVYTDKWDRDYAAKWVQNTLESVFD